MGSFIEKKKIIENFKSQTDLFEVNISTFEADMDETFKRAQEIYDKCS